IEIMKSYQSANERGELSLDHVIITVKDLDRSIAFYETTLKPLGSVHAFDYDGKNGPEGHPDLKGFGRDGRVFFWLRQGDADASARVGHERAKLSVSACRFGVCKATVHPCEYSALKPSLTE